MNGPPAILIEPYIELLRDLASQGVPLIACASDPNLPATRSRYVSEVIQAPERWSPGYDSWLASLAERFPGAVALPGTEPDAWTLASWRDRNPDTTLKVAAPPSEAFHTLTAKHRLYLACREVRLAAPATWLASDEESAVQGAASAPYPLVVKPQTRVGNSHWGQGQFVRNESELRDAVRWALANVHFHEEVVAAIPEIAVPIVQEFIGRRDRPVYHLCGYLSGDGESAVLAHRKLLQFPRRFGNGLCFETAPVDHALAEQLVAMLRVIGFSGIFEAEFVERPEERLLIDLNPRSYNGLTLESARGLHLAWYAYLEASGEHDRLRDELRDARSRGEGTQMIWCRKLEFWAMVVGQTAGRGFSLAQTRRWTAWYWRNRGRMFDPYVSPGDRAVGRARLRRQLGLWAHRPRQFLGVYARPETGR